MNMKRLALIGVLALVVIGCVVASGCTSTTTETTTTTTTTSDDSVVGIWTPSEGGIVVFTDDLNGIMASGDDAFNFTWKKTTDGQYQVDLEDGTQVIWTLDNVKGTLTNAAGEILTKQASEASGTVTNGTVTNLDKCIESGNNFVYSFTYPNGREVYHKIVNGKDKGTYVKLDDGRYLLESFYDPYANLFYPPFNYLNNN